MMNPATLGNALLVTIFPQPCRNCGGEPPDREDGIACRVCWSEIESLRAKLEVCAGCGEWLFPLPSPSAGGLSDRRSELVERRCGRCHDLKLSFARSCGPHLGALRESVLWLKSHPELPRAIRRLLAETIRSLPIDRFDALIPIPLHRSRESERSFNQSGIIAAAIADLTSLPVDAASLVRHRPTERHRLGMGRRERSRSLAGAFSVRAPRLVANRRLLLIDDVMTTGSTAGEAAITLLDHQASEVALLSISKASPGLSGLASL